MPELSGKHLKILKALANPTRFQILEWLKDPIKNFGPQLHANFQPEFQGGACVGSIKRRCQISQSTISAFMSCLEDAGLVESQKLDQYTYFHRNEENIQAFTAWMKENL